MAIVNQHQITTVAELENLYGSPSSNSLNKELGYISKDYRAYIERSPFLAISTSGNDGLDCSPRGDLPGFVRVQDEKTILIPDRSGNRRLDTLRNLIEDPRVSLLFLVPGIGQTIRINGTAEISVAPDLLATFLENGKEPQTVLRVTVDTIYFQCPKALIRSGLWDANRQAHVDDLPTAAEMVKNLKA